MRTVHFTPRYLALTLAAALALSAVSGARAQEHDSHAGHGHQAPPVTPAAAPAQTPASAMHGMDHGDMRMQGGSPPADARDPHAYSGDFERGQGQHVPAGVSRLELADQHAFWALQVNRLERAWARRRSDFTAYDLQGRFGRDFDHLVLKAEGEVAGGKLQASRTELLWGHAIVAYWDTRLGVRFDQGEGRSRPWLAFGVQGLAPYWFELEATAYVGSGGRTALRLEAEYDWRLTQKLILQPKTEWNFHGQDDRANAIGKGLGSASASLRLRYEITRQIAPYVGVEWQHAFSRTADLLRASGARATQTRWVAGLSFWF